MKLYRVADGIATVLAIVTDAVEPGRYDANNWATDWVVVRAASPGAALRIAAHYDARLNAGIITRPRFLRPIGRWIAGEQHSGRP